MPRKITPLIERVMSKVDTQNDPALQACWIWRGARSKKRYGHRPVIQTGGRGSPVALVARLVCEWTYGPAPTSHHEAGHICPDGEREDCVNPNHLVWQTRRENEAHKRRMQRRKRSAA